MARRNLIHRKHLSLLMVYFRKMGWTILKPKGMWEVFRARRDDRKDPVIVYRSFNSEHFTIQDRDYKIFANFLSWLKDNEIIEEEE